MSDASPDVRPLASPRLRTRRWRAIVVESGLPDELAALVTALVRRTRLWPSERADVARELVMHFRDGLASGVSVDDLAQSFGDPAASARLITRARRKSRPTWYFTLLWARRGVAACMLLLLVAYGYLAARYYLAQPVLSRNYAAEFNTASLATDESQRAWPVMLQAIRAFGPLPEFARNNEFPIAPTDPNWAEATVFIHAKADALALVRQAAARPALGVRYSNASDPDLLSALQVRQKVDMVEEAPDVNPMLIGVLLPHLGEMRRFARMLAFDARVALTTGDRDRVMEDLTALLNMSTLAWSEPFIISDLVALAVLDLACMVSCEAAASGHLTPVDLRNLAHRLSIAPATSLDLDFAADAAGFDDFAQRFFTDDGRGNGHTVYASIPKLRHTWGIPDPSGRMIVRAALPAMTIRHVSRAEFHRLTVEATAAAQHDQAIPLWRRSERSGDEVRDRLDQAMGEIFPPMLPLMNGGRMGGVIVSRDIIAARREATLTALAIECHRSKHGTYPSQLAALVPSMLPQHPIDAADGRPLRYQLRDGRPLLYSIGCDEDDDGGRPPKRGVRFAHSFDRAGAQSPFGVMGGGASPQSADDSDGDWIFYPPPANP